MQTAYEKWMEQERAWIKAIEDQRKKKAYMHTAIAVVCCVAALFGIGFLAGGVAPAIANIKYGLILGAFGGGLYLVIMLCGNMTDKYVKGLEKEMSREIRSETEKEEIAGALMGAAEGREPAACMEFVRQKGAVPERLCVSGNIAILRGMIPCVVRLEELEQMEVDVVQSVSTIRTGDYNIRLNYSTYPIFFYYKKPQDGTVRDKKQKPDKVMVFPSKGLRDEAARLMSRA